MYRFRYFGSFIHAVLHHLKKEAQQGYIPDTAPDGPDVTAVVQMCGRYIPSDALCDLDSHEADIIGHYWSYLRGVLRGYEQFWLKAEVNGRKHDIVGVRDGWVEFIDVITTQEDDYDWSFFSRHVGFQHSLRDTPVTTRMLQQVCGMDSRHRIIVIQNDLEDWHEPQWFDMTDGAFAPVPSTTAYVHA